jgi:hypothetical protein
MKTPELLAIQGLDVDCPKKAAFVPPWMRARRRKWLAARATFQGFLSRL